MPSWWRTDSSRLQARGRAGEGRPFLVRWTAAVSLSMLVAGGIEYMIAANQLEERSLSEAAKAYEADVAALAEILSAADMAPAVRQEAVSREVSRIAATLGTRNVLLFDADGRLVAALDEEPSEDKSEDIRAVLASGRPDWEEEEDEGETGQEHRYEFLLPLRGAAGQGFVVEVDQQADIIEGLLADLRRRKVAGLLLGLLIAVPLSYALGGRSLQHRQTRAERAADTDSLTGLAGRRPFRPTLQSALLDPAAGPTVLALIDIDEFKGVNDRLGHSYGDRVLCAVADSFSVALRAADTAFRLGGDEFAVVLTGGDDARAAEAIERVRQRLADSVPGITFSCGLAVATAEEAVPLQELWERADAALYEAKHRGRRQTVAFSTMADCVTVSADRLDAVNALLLDDAGLHVAFQPIWDLRKGSLLGHEALLRLPADSPVAGPHEAFELAQRLGIAGGLDRQARRTVLRAVAQLDWRGYLFLNVHPDALPDLDVDALVEEVAAAGLTPSQVVLEVTEHDGLDRPEPVRVLKRAHARDFRLALDDMGSGNAGLRALRHVRFDVLKLDRQVTARLGTDPACDATLAAVTTFVQMTGGWVVAEGIEDASMLSAVLGDVDRPLGVTAVLAGQGYLLGHPAPAPAASGSRLDRHGHAVATHAEQARAISRRTEAAPSA